MGDVIALDGRDRPDAPPSGAAQTRAILRGEDSDVHFSLRRHVPRSKRMAAGKGLRQAVPLRTLGDWQPPADRGDLISQLEAQHEGRLDDIVPIRVGRMADSPYGFLRGAAAIMAADLASLPATGIMPVICGDAHLGNFGCYASPERKLVLDLTDFDEAHPGCWEWDLRRLAASIWVAGRQAGRREDQCEAATAAAAAAYRERLRALARRPLLERSFDYQAVDRLSVADFSESLRKELRRTARKARNRTSAGALPRFTEQRDGERRIVEEPPLISRVGPADEDRITAALDNYLSTLPPHWRRVVGAYAVRDVALKVVGLGSVGLPAYVVLCEGSGHHDVLFLQLKEARRSVIARHVHGEIARHNHQGQRAVEYQQALQTVSDPLLGWTTIGHRHYYVRQLRDMKGSVDTERLKSRGFAEYAGICGRLLARAHARTAIASLIAGYLGSSPALENAMCQFARSYADQTERDHQTLAGAVGRGRIAAERGV